MSITTVIECVLLALAVLAFVPTLIFCAEIVASVKSPKGDAHRGERERLAVLIPAHNEAASISRTIYAILPQLRTGDRVVVVADNCSDETATLARAAGAECISRQDQSKRGKGYALDFGITHLQVDAPRTVIVVDADCVVDAGAIDQLARACSSYQRPVQALYLMSPGQDASHAARLRQFAWVVKNLARPIGLKNMNMPCQLMGTGMAFTWEQISATQLASGHIVEDMKLGLDLARAGKAPVFLPSAKVYSEFPTSESAVKSQRTRWEHGHLGVITREVPALLVWSIARRDRNLLTLALDLSVPPVALLTLCTMSTWISALLFFLFTDKPVPLAGATFDAVLLTASVCIAWRHYGRNIVPLRSMALASRYALSKIPLYARFIVSRQLHWVRTKRNDE